MRNILLIEDEVKFAQKLIEYLVKKNFNVFYGENAEEAKTILMKNRVDVAIVDLMLPPTFSKEGINILQFLQKKYSEIEILMITTKQNNTTELVSEAMRDGAQHFLDKKSEYFFKKLFNCLEEIYMEKKNNIFISHGHNELIKLKLRDFIQNHLDKSPVILSEVPSRGYTIVEKLEKVSEMCNFAVILLTKDDEQKNGGLRARQNVIHEIGFFQGKYGRKNVVLLAERGVELFTNISGIVILEFDPNNFEAIYEPLRIEFKAAFQS